MKLTRAPSASAFSTEAAPNTPVAAGDKNVLTVQTPHHQSATEPSW